MHIVSKDLNCSLSLSSCFATILPTECEALGTVCLRPHGYHLPCPIHRLACHSCLYQNSFSLEHYLFMQLVNRYLVTPIYGMQSVVTSFGNLDLMGVLTCENIYM
jgi:hypothetical protein